MPAELLEISGDVIDETSLAWKFVPDGADEDDHVWCPKSICEWEENDEGELDTSGTMSVPKWFAHKEGLS